MLVLTRKQSESIQIGEDVVIKVIRTGKGSVKIGIEAPRDVRVVRGELSGPRDVRPASVSDDDEESEAAARKLPAAVADHGYFTLPQAV